MLDHGRKFIGPTYPEQLLHLPVFNSTTDIGRLIFNVTDGLLYVGKLTGWATLAAGALSGSSGTSGSSGFGSSGTSGTSGQKGSFGSLAIACSNKISFASRTKGFVYGCGYKGMEQKLYHHIL